MAAEVRKGRWEAALSLKHSNLSSVDAMIFATSFTACKKGLSWQMALSLLLEMDELRVERDLISFNASLNAIGSAHQWQRALALRVLAALLAGVTSSFALAAHAEGETACRAALEEGLAVALAYSGAPVLARPSWHQQELLQMFEDWARDFTRPRDLPVPECETLVSYWPAFMSFAFWPAAETVERFNQQASRCGWQKRIGVWDSRYATHPIAVRKIQALLADKASARAARPAATGGSARLAMRRWSLLATVVRVAADRRQCPYYQASGCILDQLEKVCEGEAPELVAPAAEENLWMCCCPEPYVPCSPNESDTTCVKTIGAEIKAAGEELSLQGLMNIREKLLDAATASCGDLELGDGNAAEFAQYDCPMIQENQATGGDERKGHRLNWDPRRSREL
eukprot:g11690.t1